MGNLTAKQESFIRLMQKSEEHARKGFEVLAARSDANTYFDALSEAGLFESKNNFGPIPTDEPGYVRIPYWAALDYLEAIAKFAGVKEDIQLAEKVLAVIRDVSRAEEQESGKSDNYHTWRKFAEIISLVPASTLTTEVIDLIPIWINCKFDRGMVGAALDKGLLKKLLAGGRSNELAMAARILNHCTAIFEDAPPVEGRKKPVTVIDHYWLKKLIDHHSESFGVKAGREAAEIFRKRVQEVFGEYYANLPTYVSRPAVEKNEQNQEWNRSENCFVEGLRDVLLAWVEHDSSNSPQDFVAELLRDKNEMVRRVAIHVLSQRWHHLKRLYQGLVGPELFNARNIHEVYHLLHERFGEFPETYKDMTLNAIRDLPLLGEGEDSVSQLRYSQRNWLSAIVGKGYEPADAWFNDLMSDVKLGSLSSHPDFHYYMESWSGSGPSPYTVQELLAYAEAGCLIQKMNEFQPSTDWRGPSVQALVKTLKEAVKLSPKIFLHLLPEFHKANRPYQYGVISGYKHLWDSTEDSNKLLEWDTAWPKLFDFFEILLSTSFWAEEVVNDKELTPTRKWIPSEIAEFLRAGTKKDEHAFSADLLPRSISIIEMLLEKSEPASEAGDDPMFQAINSEKGKAIEALFNQALRTCRVRDKEVGQHIDAWAALEPIFNKELAKCTNGNYEFSTLAASYMPNLEYMSLDWLKANLDKIFSVEHPINFICAIDGLTYCSTTRSNYGLLAKHGVIDRALKSELKGREARERMIQRICLGYLWGDELLDSPRILYLFESLRIDDLKAAIDYFWSVRDQDLTDIQIAMVLDFWDKCLESVDGLSEIPKQLMSRLSRLSCYVRALAEREYRLLMAVAPFASIDHNADEFIEDLNRLVETYPAETSKILGIMLSTYKPSFDYEDRLKSLLTKLSEKGKREDALDYANALRHLPGFLQLFK